ncbi:MAG: hypothetical protein ABR865_13370, partial [Terracidiphilus sp.]
VPATAQTAKKTTTAKSARRARKFMGKPNLQTARAPGARWRTFHRLGANPANAGFALDKN